MLSLHRWAVSQVWQLPVPVGAFFQTASWLAFMVYNQDKVLADHSLERSPCYTHLPMADFALTWGAFALWRTMKQMQIRRLERTASPQIFDFLLHYAPFTSILKIRFLCCHCATLQNMVNTKTHRERMEISSVQTPPQVVMDRTISQTGLWAGFGSNGKHK